MQRTEFSIDHLPTSTSLTAICIGAFVLPFGIVTSDSGPSSTSLSDASRALQFHQIFDTTETIYVRVDIF